jgi:hypothetical protein
MNIGWLIGGILCGLFAFAQFLQFLGLFGVGSSIAGLAITLGATVATIVCFRNAFPKPPE